LAVRKKDDYRSTDEQYARVNQTEYGFWVRLIHGRGRGKAGCRSRLTPEGLRMMFDAQSGRCALSGIPMSTTLVRGGDWARCSVDRIDNSKGYDYDNIHLVCKGVNVARNSMSIDEFVTMCRNVSERMS
jgi:hypothetical protein